MGTVIVQNKVDIQILWHLRINVSQEADKFRASVVTFEFAQYFARSNIQSSEQRGSAVAPVVVSMLLR